MTKLALFLLTAVLLLSACTPAKDPPWLGYGEGEDVFVAAPAPGWVTKIAVTRGQDVRAGALLFTLDDTRERAGRDQALANLESVRAQLKQNDAAVRYAGEEAGRQGRLARVSAGVADTLDLARSNYAQGLARTTAIAAQIEQAKAALADAEYQLSERKIVAKVAGRVDDIYFRAGEYVPPSTAVLALLPPQNVFVRFFVPEHQFAQVKMGERVRIACDGCRPMTATISFVAAEEEFTPPVIFSAESRDKLVFKLEARTPQGLPINPGEPVQVELR